MFEKKVVKLLGSVFVPVAIMSAAPVFAQPADWPSKNLRLVVPFPPGGSTDVIARALAVRMEKKLGKSVVVENVTGGATVPAVQNVLRADADGHTLFISSDVTFSVNPHLLPSISYAPLKDFAPVTILGTTANWMIVRSDRPEKTFGDLAKTIAANPGKVTIGVNAIGGAAHLGLEAWKKAEHLDFTVVPYRGGPAAVTDLLGGQVTATVDVTGSSVQYARAGKVRPLAVFQERRSTALKDLPTARESNKTAPEISTYLAIVVKAGTSPDRVQKLNKAIKESVADAEFQTLMRSNLLYDPVVNSPEEASSFLKSELVRYGKLVSQAGIKLE